MKLKEVTECIKITLLRILGFIVLASCILIVNYIVYTLFPWLF